jgi:hypothetical protein
MGRRIRFVAYFIVILILLLDSYIYFNLRHLFDLSSLNFTLIYWAVPVFLLGYLIYLIKLQPFARKDPGVQNSYFNFFGLFILFYIPKMFFAVFSLSEKVITFVSGWFYGGNIHLNVISWFGAEVALLLFVLILYGILIGRFHFRMERRTFPFSDLPEEFDGLKLVQISDLHIGGWKGNKNKLKKVVKRINSENPDLLVLTGDLFNYLYQEIHGFQEILKSLHAREAKLAILGNHDYGDYFPWNSQSEKNLNFSKIKESYTSIGFHLLCNESVTFRRNGEQLAVIGVENWGLPPFHQYGDLDQAMSRLNGTVFSILLSHDPSHWKAKVVGKDGIRLTLSGHTHGMQFGIYTKRIKWSPAKLKYPEWGGLYRQGKQLLYVNKGLGYIGFPGRIGIRPEITVLTLKHKKRA